MHPLGAVQVRLPRLGAAEGEGGSGDEMGFVIGHEKTMSRRKVDRRGG